MVSSIVNITFDAHDPYAQASWWAQVLGGTIGPEDAPGHPECEVLLPTTGAPDVLFIVVPEGKAVKNRVHLDLQPQGDATRESETDRVVALGATVVDDLRNSDGTGWVVLTDPEGNEFCILRSQAQRAATGD